MNSNIISRRRFAHLLGLGAASALARPRVVFADKDIPRLASPATASKIVRLSSNENPYGPSPQALQAMTDAFGLSGRYPDDRADALVDGLAQLNGVKPEQILLGDGSSEILDLCAAAFSGKGRTLVVGDPTFEAIVNNARVIGAEVTKIPLTSSYGHDLPKMAAAAREGLIYVCNPNNPTASITPKDELRDFIAKAPATTMILVDEAYFHYADSPSYESVIPLIREHANLIVARTFSKIYGMAGLRCGYCAGQAETIARLRPHQMWDSVNILALAAAQASLSDPEQVNNGRRMNKEARSFTTAALTDMGYRSIPSEANFIMIDLKRPVVPLIKAMKERNVQVGRLFPTLPTHLRLTIGTQSEMETCLAALRQSLS